MKELLGHLLCNSKTYDLVLQKRQSHSHILTSCFFLCELAEKRIKPFFCVEILWSPVGWLGWLVDGMDGQVMGGWTDGRMVDWLPWKDRKAVVILWSATFNVIKTLNVGYPSLLEAKLVGSLKDDIPVSLRRPAVAGLHCSWHTHKHTRP